MSRYTLIIYVVMFVLVNLLESGAAQDLRELAQEHARKHPGKPLHQTAPPGDYWPKSIEEVTNEADVVLEAKLSRSKSYVNHDRVLTDYLILNHRVITGRPPKQGTNTPGPIVPLVLTVYGGEVIVDGVLIRGTDSDREPISDGSQYLLFLRPARQHGRAGHYEIYYGAIFEEVDDKVTPLLREADAVFKGTVRGSRQDLIRRIESASRVH